MSLVLRGGRVIDPANGVDRFADLVIADGEISGLMEPGAGSGDTVRDVTGMVVAPGFIDLHVHLREPGFEYKEDIESGCRAAAAGGFTSVCCMPNTNPAIDTPGVVQQIIQRANGVGLARVLPVAAVTKGLAGDALSEMAELKAAGAVAMSDDAFPLQNSETMRRAMEYCSQFGLVLMTHNEDKALTVGGSMNEGLVATELGLGGIPAVSEDIAAARNILLSKLTGCRLHLLHISTGGTADLLALAKADGIPVTGETAPHYWALTDKVIAGYNTNAKMNPPIRTQADGERLVQGLADGTIDAIATDHAPHAPFEKEREFDKAPFGILGLETSFGVAYTTLVATGRMTLPALIARYTCGPADVLGLPTGRLTVGSPADVAVIDPRCQWVVDPQAMRSKSRNTPFGGMALVGKPVFTVLAGQVVEA